MTYTTIERGAAIKCKICGFTSWNMNDVVSFYCGRCHIFHKDVEAAVLGVLKSAVKIPQEVWLADANTILKALEGHPNQGMISFRLGVLHSIVNKVSKKA